MRFLGFVLFRTLLGWSSQMWRNRRWRRGQIDWNEQVVLVTGGSEGLGRVLVETLLLKHITVIVLDIKPFSGPPQSPFSLSSFGSDDLAVYLFDRKIDRDEEEEGDLKFYQCDVSDPRAVEKAAIQIRKDVGSPTIIVNNAGIVHGKSILELEPDELQKCVSFEITTVSFFDP
jgi:NAD(P)-dependent dehydrogenase (short-subunit alcohol dehydrogenase family)